MKVIQAKSKEVKTLTSFKGRFSNNLARLLQTKQIGLSLQESWKKIQMKVDLIRNWRQSLQHSSTMEEIQTNIRITWLGNNLHPDVKTTKIT